MVGKDAWYNFNFLIFTEVWFVTQAVVYPGECSMYIWEDSVLFCIWMECPEDINEVCSSNVSFKTCFLINFLFWLSAHCCKWGVKSITVIVHCQFLLLCLLVFVLCIEVALYVVICWVHRYLKLSCLPLGLIPWSFVVSFLISCNLLYFKVYFVWYEDCYSSFLLLPICMEYIFHPLTFNI